MVNSIWKTLNTKLIKMNCSSIVFSIDIILWLLNIKSLKYLIELGEVEKTIYLLAEEIEATKRRVNSLEHIMIPRFQNTEKYIDMRLQEMERENFVRLKMIRSTIEKNEKAAAAAAAAENAE